MTERAYFLGMLNRVMIVVYGLVLAWGGLWLFKASEYSDWSIFWILGFPPLAVVVLGRWMATGRMP